MEVMMGGLYAVSGGNVVLSSPYGNMVIPYDSFKAVRVKEKREAEGFYVKVGSVEVYSEDMKTGDNAIVLLGGKLRITNIDGLPITIIRGKFGKAGTLKWKFKTGGAINSSPAIGPDGTIYVGGGYYLYAINPDGTLKWKFKADRCVVSSPVIGPDGTVYIGSFLVEREATAVSFYAIHTDSPGVAKSPWPCFRGHPLHLGRTFWEARKVEEDLLEIETLKALHEGEKQEEGLEEEGRSFRGKVVVVFDVSLKAMVASILAGGGEAELRVSCEGAEGFPKTVAITGDALKAGKIEVPAVLPEGEYRLKAELMARGRVMATAETTARITANGFRIKLQLSAGK